MINFSNLSNLSFWILPRLSFLKSYSSSICDLAISNSTSCFASIFSEDSETSRSILSSLVSSREMISVDTALPTPSAVCLTTSAVAFELATVVSEGLLETPVNPQSPPESNPSKKSKSARSFSFRCDTYIYIFYTI